MKIKGKTAAGDYSDNQHQFDFLLLTKINAKRAKNIGYIRKDYVKIRKFRPYKYMII